MGLTNFFLSFAFVGAHEVSAGSKRTLVVYSLGGLASSAAALLMMIWSGEARFFVGPSGSFWALLGSEIGRAIWDRRSWRERKRQLWISSTRYAIFMLAIIFLLLANTGLVFLQQHISVAAFVPSFVVGLLISLAVRRQTPPIRLQVSSVFD
jgi:membrane associated rhomboid family serine protease